MTELPAGDLALLARRFWSRVVVVGDCWEWTGGSDGRGYDHFARDGRQVKAHRMAWELTYGKPPERWVLHHCDNPSCVRPEHLFEGDHQANMDDMWAKGRGRLPAIPTHCRRGHIRDEVNTYRDKRGRGACRPCALIRYHARPKRHLPHPAYDPAKRDEWIRHISEARSRR